MIRIGFDGRALVSPAAGIRRYTRELFGAMAGLDGVQVVAVGMPEGGTVPAGVECAPGAGALPTNVGWMLTGLPRAAGRARLDVFHAPSYTAPLRGPRPLVLTIHDVSYARHPEWYPYRRDPLRRLFYRWSARTADLVLTDSQFSKREIVAAYGLAPDRIEVAPLAAAPLFLPGPRTPPALFVLHVGDIHPRRNLSVVVRAIPRLRERRRDLRDLRLVLAGVNRGPAGEIQGLAAGAGPALIEMRGRTTDDELLVLYRTAIALVYPTRYEGFGLPLLEAMACGTPVIASHAASIPEVTGDAALLLAPDDEAGWAEAIEAVTDAGTAARMREAGLLRASLFTWRRTAELTLAAYRRVTREQEIRRSGDQQIGIRRKR
ncbi:glycosyltransferase family 1 protein [soil metagenome]